MKRTLIIFSIIPAIMASGGCYHRVVSTKGLGGMGKPTDDPYRSDTAADRAVDRLTGASQPSQFRGADTMPVTKNKSRWSASTTGGGITPMPKGPYGY